MKILLLGLNYAPELIGTGPYTTGLVEALAQRGHEVRAVVGQPYYPGWRPRPGHRGWSREDLGRARIYRVPHFIPSRPSGVLRLVHQASFALAATPIMLAEALLWRPERVITIAPSLLAAPLGLLASRLSGAGSWLHLQDFELEAALATGLVSTNHTIIKLLAAAERRILRRFDRVSSISPAMCRRLVEKGVSRERVAEHRNWGDLTQVMPLGRPSAFRQKWNITTPHIALYSGALGRKQGLDLVIAAARSLSDCDDITFVICGNGPYRAELEAMAGDLGNMRFFDLQPREQLSELLGLATMHLLPQIAGAADLVLPSKLANMLASGRPVIATAASGTGIFEEIEGCGLAVEPGDAAALSAAIERLCDDPALAENLGATARRRAERRWHRETILAHFVGAIEAADRNPSLAPVAESQHR
ncbi:WcaI family glycosyltransferase [Devosia sp.]|uniref:WcaI family glycosyltransferase n=1 Tax=Devosia sp. TaxID=1871048 RepID=UPI001B132080|nr:WcaI family glycosyltransferase [Devosia sp.]MBO9589021.1 WcaI family glycosyltransferase [Devosia sp.]